MVTNADSTQAFCVGGAPLQVDCLAYGFTACDTFMGKVQCYQK